MEEFPNLRSEQVFVSHVDDAVTFWAQCLDRGHELTKVSDDLARICPTMDALFGDPDLGKIYGALFSEDNCWYRCRVQCVINDEKYQVTYVDYGNSEVLNTSRIVELPEELQFPSIAQKYRLWGLQLSNPDTTVSQQGTTFLINMINEKQITVRHKVTYKDNTIVVQAEYCDLDIGEEVSKKGFALKCKTVPSFNNNKGNIMDLMCPGVKPHVPSNLRSRPVVSAPAGDQKSPPDRLLGHFNIHTPSLSKNENVSGNDRPVTHLSPAVSPDSAVLKDSELMLIEENKRLKCELDLILRKCQSLESEIQLLHVEAQKEKLIVDETYRDLERSFQTAVGDTLRSLSAKIEFLKAARRENINIRFGADLSEAIRLVSDECITAPSSLEKLDEIWKQYDLAQQMINLCKHVDEVNALIAQRNCIQQGLFVVVQEFILEVDKLPLTGRTTSLQQISLSLEAVYGQVTGAYCSDRAFHDFYEWKQTKIEEFTRVRHDTDESLQVLFIWFNDLGEFFDLTSSISLTSDQVVGNIDEILKKVELDIDKELDISVVERNESDNKIIIGAYNKVIEKIKQEQELIKVVMSKHAKSIDFETQMSEWHHKSPNIDDLLIIKKTLKGLKTQLRWKSIELRSLEESDEFTATDVMKIKENIAILRSKIFEEVYREQREYEKLSSLAQKWFPELPLLHPEAGISMYMESGGLLSGTLERELFDAEPLKELSSKRPVVRADVQGQKVLLKGYSVGVDTETKVIERAAKYHIAWSVLKEESGLLPLLFLFFCKSDPLVYLIVPFHPGESLEEVQTNKPLTTEEVAKVMKGVARGLETLHKANIVHGSVHQNNVFAVNRMKGILADFDFTKTDYHRNLINSVSYLNLTAPEVRTGQFISTSSDMYSYGCLLLWTCHGDYCKLKSDGTPDIDKVGIASNLKSLLSKLVTCTDRITATQVIEDDYFQIHAARKAIVASNGMDGENANREAGDLI
ncbi:serine/threonine-protein kinase 31-like [Ambystoma mexicanum]|uniref:serine/threonine-protein kinase 31-like n=1 Tax=Ambystoma mexicanum TaxID=8296 RepID=UPI0037E791DA